MSRDDLQLVSLNASPGPTRPDWAEISASSLRHNYQLLTTQAALFQAEIIGVIKANAYGHGIDGCARVLTEAGAQWLAVTSVDEGVQVAAALRHAGLSTPRILILGGLFGPEDARRAVRHELTPVILAMHQLMWLAEAANREGAARHFPFHLEIDTGMARHGMRWDDGPQLDAAADFLGQQTWVSVEALMTHFASADDPSSPQTDQQQQYFTHAIKRLYALGVRPPLLHAGNSSTLFDGSNAEALMELAHTYSKQLLMRPGLALYGYGPQNHDLQPVLTWKSRITGLRRLQAGDAVSYNATFHAMRSSTIATIAVGYADGLNRLLSNKGSVLIRGQRAPVVGRITMDQTMVDVSVIEDAAIGDEVVLIGSQGDLTISAAQVATLTGTIPWEVLCDIGARVHRIVIE